MEPQPTSHVESNCTMNNQRMRESIDRSISNANYKQSQQNEEMQREQQLLQVDQQNTTKKAESVSTIVAKSKKAASSIWTLLHAKSCRLGYDRCCLRGCAEAKLIHLHLKTCAAGPASSCPAKHKGCDESRKLLAHYRRCRDIRARQAGQYPRTQQHVCLVCSLVARQAKGLMDKNTSISQRKTNTKHTVTTYALTNEGNVSVETPSQSTTPMKKMPPPPPRIPTLQLYNNGTTAAKMADVQSHGRRLYALDDNVVVIPSNVDRLRSRRCQPTSQLRMNCRQRSESFDERRSSTTQITWVDPPSPTTDAFEQPNTNPAMDGELDEESKSNGRLNDLYEPNNDVVTIHRRKRSASCSVIPTANSLSSSTSTSCEPITEEDLC